METGKLNQSISIYKINKGQDADGNDFNNVDLVISCRAQLLKSTNKDYVNKDFSTTSSILEKSFILRYNMKKYIATENKVLYKGDWYEVIDIESDESYRETLKIRLKQTKVKGVVNNG